MPNLGAFIPVKLKTLRGNLVELVFDSILSGKFKPGERLNESELARRLEVSRTPIREALHQLEEQGIVINNPRRGMFVVALTEQDVQEIVKVRLVLEAEALSLCKEHFDLRAERKLIRLLKTLDGIGPDDVSFSSIIDLHFHRTMWAQANNKCLERMLVRVTAPLFVFAAADEQLRKPGPSHRPFLQFLQGKSQQSAHEVVLQHLMAAYFGAQITSGREGVAVAH